MKKLTTLGFIAVLALMILLAGCGKKAQEPVAGPDKTTDAVKPVEVPKSPETPATAPVEAKPVEAAPVQAAEPVQASELGIDEAGLDLGENPDTGASEVLDVPTLE